jgi:hypothetical protein
VRQVVNLRCRLDALEAHVELHRKQIYGSPDR